MAASSTETRCSICNEETNAFLCHGCSKDFCLRHLIEHQQLLNEQFGLIQNGFNEFTQTLINMKNNSEKHPLIKQIDEWEIQSIAKIKQKANECREILRKYTDESIHELDTKLNEIIHELSPNQKQKKDVNEIQLDKMRQKLKELNDQFNQPENISIEQLSDSLISDISIRLTGKYENILIPKFHSDQTWKQNATTIAGGHGKGDVLNQLSKPFGIFIDHYQTIVIADQVNHRIVEWKKNSNDGQIIAGENGKGNRNDQLTYPLNVIVDRRNDSLLICDWGNRRVVRWPRRNGRTGEILISNIRCSDLKMDNDGFLYVSDEEKHEVRRWKIGETNGTIVAGGNGQGDRLDQLNEPRNIFIDNDYSIYVTDWKNHRVMKWLKGAKEGIVVAGGQGQGNGLRQLLDPNGIIVDKMGSIFVADSSNDRVMRWSKGASEGTIVVGGNGRGDAPNQLNGPVNLSFDGESNVNVLDNGNNRVQRFDIS